jgi:hypothetical protein
MSLGVGIRNSIAIGIGGIISLFSGYGRDQVQNNLAATEDGDNIVQEDGGFILV